MPDLKFREEEPERSIPVMPTISRQAEIQAAAVEANPHAQEPRVRYAEWNEAEDLGPSDVFHIPKWFFLLGSATIWFAIGFMFLAPEHLIRLPGTAGFPESAAPYIPNFAISMLVVFGIWMLYPIVCIRQIVRNRKRVRRRVGLESSEKARFFGWMTGRAPELSETEVVVCLAQDGVIYGRDDGLLRFEGSSLYFEGVRLSFSISKSRLSLRPEPKDLMRAARQARAGGLPPTLVILSYRDRGVTYEIGFANTRRGFSVERSQELAMVQDWIAQHSEPAEYEVLLPAAVPPNVLREAREAIRQPALVAQGALVFVGMALSLHLMQRGFDAKYPKMAGTNQFGVWVVAALGLEVLGFAFFGVIKPLIRAIRRYRFLKERS